MYGLYIIQSFKYPTRKNNLHLQEHKRNTTKITTHLTALCTYVNTSALFLCDCLPLKMA